MSSKVRFYLFMILKLNYFRVRTICYAYEFKGEVLSLYDIETKLFWCQSNLLC